MRDSNHFTFPELSRWSVLYSEINTMNATVVKSSQVSGGGREKKNGENNIWQGFVQGFPPVDGLRWRINLLIEVTFVLNTTSSVYFKHISPSLHPPSPQMSSTLSVLCSNGIMRDWTTYGRCWSPSLLEGVIIPAHPPTPPSGLSHYQMACM